MTEESSQQTFRGQSTGKMIGLLFGLLLILALAGAEIPGWLAP